VVDRDNLPTFLVIGAMKAGTTSLYEYLRAHPQVFMATPKELHFFPASKHWPDGVDWYAAHFEAAHGARARGEISPSYSQADQFPGVAARVAQIVPDAKIVYLVREPVARAQSMYLHEVAAGRETLPIDAALATKPLYVNSSRYATQLDEYLRYFGREQIFVFTSESLRGDRAGTLRRLFAFLDVDPDAPIAPVEDERGRTGEKRTRRAVWHQLRDNRAYRAIVDHAPPAVRKFGQRALTRPIDVDAGALSDAALAQLRDELRPEVARLREFLPADFDGWGLL
jgi:sulfotransferase family protein